MIEFNSFTEFIQTLNQDLGRDFCNQFQQKRKELTNAGRVPKWGILFGNVYDYLEDKDYAYAINQGSTNELQYNVFFTWDKIRYGIGFNTHYVPFRGMPLNDVVPFMESFLLLENYLQNDMLDYRFVLGNRKQIEYPKNGQYTLWGKEFSVKYNKDIEKFQIEYEDYEMLQADLKVKMFEAYVKIFEERNRIIKNSTLSLSNIADFHEKIYIYLQEKRKENPDLYFYTRNTDTYGRLEKGYWFWGNDDYITLTFWKGSDKKQNRRYIAFVLEAGVCTLNLRSTDDERIAKVFKTMAAIIPQLHQLKSAGEEMAVWQKKYENVDYLANIEAFLADKKTIDSILEITSPEIVDEIAPVTAEEFAKNIAIIEQLRNQQAAVENVVQEKKQEVVKLKRLELENIGIFTHISLDFSDRITVLIGENGIGKTTLLRAIALSLTGVDENTLLDKDQSKIRELLHIENESNGNAVYSNEGKIKLSYDFEENKYQNTILFSSDEYGQYLQDDVNSDFIYLQKDHFPHLILGFCQDSTSNAHLQIKNVSHQKLSNISSGHVKDLLPLLYNQPDNRFDSFTNWIINLYNIGLQKKVKENSRNEVEEDTLIHFVFETVSEIIGTELKFIDIKLPQRPEEKPIIWLQDVERKQSVPLSLVSQGMNSVLGWVGYFLMRMYESDNRIIKNKSSFSQNHAILLIDEIDTYLHPKWQRKILKVLADKFPNTQFVVTTHSPLVATHLDENAKVYRITTEGAEEIAIVGRDISSALWDYFGVERRELTYQAKIDELFILLEEEPLQTEKIKTMINNLKAILGAKDPDIQRAENIFESLLWLEKEG